MALDFLILYEHTVREYESDLLLKLELERRGYTAEIRQLLDPKHLRLFGKDKPVLWQDTCAPAITATRCAWVPPAAVQRRSALGWQRRRILKSC